MENYAKVSVLIVTYKQQDVIGRNIESILEQREYGLHEIVICDDHSPDNNWEVIQSYVRQYPNIIRAYRNDPNLGIYGNSDKCASLHGDADLFCWIEGDDAMCGGALKRLQEYISTNDIDISKPIGICCDWVEKSPGKDDIIVTNRYAEYPKAPIGLRSRGLVTWRGSFFSRSVIEQFKPTILNQGLPLAESLFDNQWFLYAKRLYYCPGIATVYYSGIGVSVNLGEGSDFQGRDAVKKWQYFLDSHYYERSEDRHWIKFLLLRAYCLYKPSLFVLIRSIPHFVGGIYWNLQFNKFSIRRYFSPMIKAILGLTHKNH